MTRVLSALVLIPVVVGVIWFLPPIATLILAEVAALLAFIEYAELARALGVEIPRVIVGAAVLATLATFANTAVLPGTMWGGDLHVVPRDVAGLDIVDVGCGTGRHAVRLAGRGANVVGVDFSDGMLARAREKEGASQVRWVVHDVAVDAVGVFGSLVKLPGLLRVVARRVADHVGLRGQCARPGE